jgi:hypothetical protein
MDICLQNKSMMMIKEFRLCEMKDIAQGYPLKLDGKSYPCQLGLNPSINCQECEPLYLT